MSGRWFGGLTVVCLIVLVNSKLDLDKALRLAHCRASCIHKLNMSLPSTQGCRASVDCMQCWDVCQRLQTASNSDMLCNNKHCVGGCLEACRWVSSSLQHPALLTTPLEELTINSSSVSWPHPPRSAPTPVYVVMVDHQQHLQTLDLTAHLPLAVDPLTVQVLVVDWRGLTSVFTPRPQSPLEQARDLVRRLGLEKTIGLNEKRSNSSSSQKPQRLKEVSRTYQLDLVRVTISWEPQQTSNTSQQIYLVTWQLNGGLLRGNLFTNTSTTTLTLQPNAVYRIQVALFTMNLSDWTSDPLEVDTHHDYSGPSQNSPVVLPAGRDPQLVACLAAVVAACLVVTLVSTWRWRHHMALPHSKLVDEAVGVTKLYRVFPPAIRLIGDDMDVGARVFSSRDNLLQD